MDFIRLIDVFSQMDEFLSIVNSKKEFHFEDEIILDGIRGEFSMYTEIIPLFGQNTKRSQNVIKFKWCDLNYFNCSREYKRIFKNSSELKESIIEMFNIKFWKGEPISDSDEFNLKSSFQKMKHELLNMEPSTCYVCFDNSRDYKTRCGHSICYPCFQKSIKYYEPEERYIFKCGICRKTYT